jgi:hypothetical protein
VIEARQHGAEVVGFEPNKIQYLGQRGCRLCAQWGVCWQRAGVIAGDCELNGAFMGKEHSAKVAGFDRNTVYVQRVLC